MSIPLLDGWRDCDYGHIAITWNAVERWDCPLCSDARITPDELSDLRMLLLSAQEDCSEIEAEADEMEKERDDTLDRVGALSMALQDLLDVACPAKDKCKADCGKAWPEHEQARKALKENG